MSFFRGIAVAALGAALLLSSSLCPAQSATGQASVEGTLSDRSGAVFAGATVTLHESSTGRSWSAKTGSTGRYGFYRLAPGAYTLSVHQGGFTQIVQTAVLTAGQAAKLSLVLNIAAVAQQVVVSSGPTLDGLTARQIRESSARDLGEAATQIAGVDKVRKAAIANDIAIRGLFHNNLAETIDGAHIYGACTGQMDPAAYHVDLSEVDHVDVVKGPFDVSTQGALGGFVKVITQTPDVRGVRLGSNVSTGSYGYYNPSATLQAGHGALHSLFGYSYRTSEFYSDGNGDKVSALGSYRNGAENLQAFRTQTMWTKLAFQPSADRRGELSYTRQQSGDLLYPYMTMDGIFDNADRFAIRYDDLRPLGWVRALHGMAYVDKINHLMDNSLRTSAGSLPVSMSAQVVSFTNGVRLDADLAQGLTAGYEFYRHYWNSNGSMTMTMMGMPTTTYSQTLPGVTQNVHGGYIAYRRAVGARILLTGGGRVDHAATDASKADPALYEAYHNTTATTADDTGVSGNVKLSWQATPAVSLFTGVGSNIRFPDAQELFFHSDSSMGTGWVGNPLLAHPRNTEYDLGLTARNGRFSFSPLLFFSKLDNAITLYGASRMQAVTGVTSMSAQSYANVQAHQWGGELNASGRLSNSLTVYESLSLVRGTKTPQPANNILSSNLFQVPPVRSQLEVRYERRGFYAGTQGIVTGRQNHTDADENELQTAGYSVFNLKAGYRARGFHLEGGIDNLLAREYSEYLSYARNPYSNGVRLPEPGRNFFVNLSYAFGRAGGERAEAVDPHSTMPADMH